MLEAVLEAGQPRRLSKNAYIAATAGDEAPNVINAIIEIPRGSKVKYELDKASGLLYVDRCAGGRQASRPAAQALGTPGLLLRGAAPPSESCR